MNSSRLLNCGIRKYRKVLPLLAMVYKSKCRTRQVVRGRAFDKPTKSTALAGALEITFSPPARSCQNLLLFATTVDVSPYECWTRPKEELGLVAVISGLP